MQSYRLAAMTLATFAPMMLDGNAARAERFSVLYSFMGAPDGGYPESPLLNVGGTLYGTTLEGGANNYGSVFKVSPAGAETIVYSFTGTQTGPDGDGPEGGLINVGGVLYGTTVSGGNDSECGTAFKVSPAGAETVLHVFCSTQNDGANPVAGLINVGGMLYGTTEKGGTGDRGTVFKMTRAGKVTILHSFGGGGDGQYPEAGLTNVDGTLYGTTNEGGANDLGAVFKVSSAGVESVLYSFRSGTDANSPMAPLLNVGGTLYGTASGGGGNSCEKGTYGCGAIFTVTLHGNEKVLYSFRGKPDGTLPEAGLINVNGVLYGTTAWGGDGRNCAGHGCGTIFKLAPDGGETVVHSFSNDQGIYSNTNLLKLGRFLYGTAPEAGGSGHGTVFAVEHR